MVKLGDAQKIIQEWENQYETRKAIRDTLVDIPPNDTTHLFHRFATPEQFQSGSTDAVTRENATSNLSEKDFQIIVTTGSIRSNFIRLLKTKYPDDPNINDIIDMIGDDIIIRATTSKGKTGWLGNLIITSRRLADVTMSNIKDQGKKIFGVR